jgi:hypothetical protein
MGENIHVSVFSREINAGARLVQHRRGGAGREILTQALVAAAWALQVGGGIANVVVRVKEWRR